MMELIISLILGFLIVGEIMIYFALDLLNTKLNRIMEKLGIKKDEEP